MAEVTDHAVVGGAAAFDQLAVDVPALYRTNPVERKQTTGRLPLYDSPFHRLYRHPLLPLKHRHALWRAARQTHLDLSWYQEFGEYWTQVLGGRPLWHVQTVYFLQNTYRQRFAQVAVADDAQAEAHLTAWQRPEVLYQLLHLVVRDSVRPQLEPLRLLFKHQPRVRSLLEFGCGTAPVTMSLFEFYRAARGMTAYIADIDTIAFHYAGHRFRRTPNVLPVRLRPEQDFLPELPGRCDAITCLAVMEHLPAPLAVIERFHELLNPGGLLLFDYVVGDGAGLDTAGSMRQRPAVLDFVERQFELVSGRIDRTASMPLTVVRKR